MSEPTHYDGEPENDPAGEQALESQLRALRTEMDVLREIVDDFMHPGDGDPQPGPNDAPFEPMYPSLEQWVVDHFAPMYARPINPTTRWCAEWWDHAEAISRLEALRRSWEVARLDELRGMAEWYRDFLDSQLAVLLSPSGPFASCTPDRHSPTKPLPTNPAPEGYWDDDDPDGESLSADSPHYQPPLAEEETR